MSQKIIHADNSEFFRKLVKTALIEEGYVVDQTDSGKETFEHAQSDNASAIIMGMALKDMSSEELLKKLLTLPNRIPVIILTSNNDETEKKRFLSIGFSAYISKTENWQELLSEELKKIL
ncbi:MAG: response regulator [Spirochaetales bacterium]